MGDSISQKHDVSETQNVSLGALRPEIMVPLLSEFYDFKLIENENESESENFSIMRGDVIFAGADIGERLIIYDAPVPKKFRNEEFIGSSQARSDRYIEDQYDLKIFLSDKRFPIVEEVGGRIRKISMQTGKELEDLHINPSDNSCCLCVPPESRAFMKKSDAPREFIKTMVIPFFYRLSCVEKEMELPAWGECRHGKEGLLEFYRNSNGKLPDEDFDLFLGDLHTQNNGHLELLLEFYLEFGKKLNDRDFLVFLKHLQKFENRKDLLWEIFHGQKKYSPDRMRKKIPLRAGEAMRRISGRRKSISM